jgi:hypothetical protein
MDGTARGQSEVIGPMTKAATQHWSIALWAAGGLLLAALALYLTEHAALGQLRSLVDPGEPLGLTSRTRADLVLALVAAYTFGVGFTARGSSGRVLAALRPVLRDADATWDHFEEELALDGHAILRAALVGVAIGVGVDALPVLLGEVRDPLSILVPTTTLMLLLFALLGVQTLHTVRQSRFFSEVGRSQVRVSLLDPSGLAPFASLGVRTAAYWFGGSAIASLLFLNGLTAWVVALVLAGTIGIGFASLLLPSRGVHLQIRERKAEELARVRAAIESGGAALFSGAAEHPDTGRLPSLIAYEARLGAVREWPFDTSTLARFLLFLLIPLASWIGGALVERVVDATLR